MIQTARSTRILVASFIRVALGSAVLGLGLCPGAYAQTAIISAGDASASEGNAGTSVLDVPVTRTGAATENIGLIYQTSVSSANPATSGTDYVAVTAGSVVLPAGETSINLPVTINGDTIAEGDEQFLVQLVSAINAGPTPNYAVASNFPTGDSVSSVAVGDFNGDGKPDLAAASFNGYGVKVLLNTTSPGATTATFAAVSSFTVSYPATSVDVNDFNGDGRADLAVATSGNLVAVLLNTATPGAATASFTAPTFFAADDGPRSVVAGDINGDGKPDLAVSNFDSSNLSVLLNTTVSGALVPGFAAAVNFAVGANPFSAALGDLNGDGRPDLASANFNDDNVSVRLNTTAAGATSPTFSAASNFSVGAAPGNVTMGDLNGDGRADLVAVNRDDDNISVLLNTTTSGAAAASFAAASNFGVGANPFGAAVGDLNGDGRADLAVVNLYGDSTSVLLNISAPGAAVARFAPASSFSVGTFPLFVAMGDLNGDGLADLATSYLNSSNVSVLLSTTVPAASDASFAAASNFAVGAPANSVAVGDLNRDGRPDVAVALPEDDNDNGEVVVLLNTTAPGAVSASFSAAARFAIRDPQSVAIGDLNGDGRLDLVMASARIDSISVLLNTTVTGSTTVSFSAPSTFSTFNYPIAVAFGDFNGDGRADIAVADNGANSAAVLLSTTVPGAAVASFAAPSNFAADSTPYSVAVADINGDGRLDIAIANYNADNVSILLNTTAAGASVASFAAANNISVGNGPQSVALGDLNGDGRPDLVTANANDDSVSVRFNNTALNANAATFGTVSNLGVGNTPSSIAIRDLNGDGKPDLSVAVSGDDNSIDSAASVLLNTTSAGETMPSFAAAGNFAVVSYPRAIAVGDFNRDGHPDLVTSNYLSNDVSIILNQLYPVSILTGEAVATIVDDEQSDFALSVSTAGTGTGTVTSVPAGISCTTAPTGCNATFADATEVTLSAAPSSTSDFTGWSGACSGTATCSVTMSEARSVVATFSLKQRDLSVALAGSGSGTVNSSPAGISCGTDCAETYADGTVVTLTATPATNADFAGWSGDCTGTGTCTVTMNSGQSATATFTLKQRDLTVTLAGSGTGSVSSSPAGINCGTDCTEVYADGTVVTLTATPSANADFAGWSGDCTGTSTCTVTMNSGKSATATFTLKQRDLTVSLAGSGTGSVSSSPAGISCGTDCTEAYADGAVVMLTASPSANSNFSGWSGACSGAGSCSVTLDAAKNVTATFTLKSLTLSVSRGGTGAGTITSSPAGINCGSSCAAAYPPGTSVALSATPGANSVFVSWSGACSGSGTCVVPMAASSAVRAIFDLAMPAVSFATAIEAVPESAGSATLTVQLSRASAEAVTVPISVGGGSAGSGDFSLAVSSISFAPNQTRTTFVVAITDDALTESNETVVLTLGAPTNAVLGSPGSTTLTILNDDSPAPANSAPQALADSSIVDEDSGLTAINVLANDSDADGDSLSIASVTQPDNGSVEILSGPARLGYRPNPDFNGTDSFSYRIADGRGGTATATVVVTVRPVADNGEAGFVTADISIDEDAGQGVITVVRSQGAEGPLRVRLRTSDGTATAGEDYEALDEVLTFADGEAGPLRVTLVILDDDIYEGDETFNVSVEPVAAAGTVAPKALSSATATIVEDDPVPLPIVEVRGSGGGSWSLLSGLVMLLGALLRRRQVLPLAAVFAIMLPGVSAAQSSSASELPADWYAGVGVGIAESGSSTRIARHLASSGYTGAQVDLDDADSSFGLYVGRDLWRQLSLELGYDDLGSYDVRITGTAADPAALAAAVVRELPVGGDALAVRLRWKQPLLDQLGLSLAAGPYYWRSERKVRAADVRLSSDDEGAGVQLDAGLFYAVTDRLQLMATGLFAKPEGELEIQRFAVAGQWRW